MLLLQLLLLLLFLLLHEKKEAMLTTLVLILLPLLPLLQAVNPSQLRSERQSDSGTPASSISLLEALPFYNGTDDPPLDDCPRNEVKLANGICYQLLTQGPCLSTHYVVLDPVTDGAYCGPRLCAPDRIFVFEDQLCYDPQDPSICPGGRQLYQTGYGTPVCQCPDGTYENDSEGGDDDDAEEESSCTPFLADTGSCPVGQVLWFRSFSSPRECIEDPCGSENLNGSLEGNLFIPSAEDGNCYPLGQIGGICPEGTWYTLALNQLEGVCSTLEDAGYLVLDEKEVKEYEEFYGPPIQKEVEEAPPDPQLDLHLVPKGTLPTGAPDDGSLPSLEKPLLPLGNPIQVPNLTTIVVPHLETEDTHGTSLKHNLTLLRGPMTKGQEVYRSPDMQYPEMQSYPMSKVFPKSRLQVVKGRLVTATRVRGSFPAVFNSQTSRNIGIPIAKKINPVDMQFADAITELLITMPSPHRWKRTTHENKRNDTEESVHRSRHHRVPRGTVLPHFAPGNIFDTRLVACRSGSKRDINAKCRDTILPSRSPPKPPPPAMSSPAQPSPGKEAGRQSRAAAMPVTPRPGCPSGESYNLQRLCEDTSAAVNSIIAHKLG